MPRLRPPRRASEGRALAAAATRVDVLRRASPAGGTARVLRTRVQAPRTRGRTKSGAPGEGGRTCAVPLRRLPPRVHAHALRRPLLLERLPSGRLPEAQARSGARVVTARTSAVLAA